PPIARSSLADIVADELEEAADVAGTEIANLRASECALRVVERDGVDAAGVRLPREPREPPVSPVIETDVVEDAVCTAGEIATPGVESPLGLAAVVANRLAD